MSSKKDSSVARFVDESEDEEDDGDYNEYDDDEDEEEDPYDDEDEEEDDENNNHVTPFAILNGYLQMNDEGRVIYYGLWRMNTESNDGGSDTSKKKRFRLKSRKSFSHNHNSSSNGDDSFDFICPSINKSRRIIIFDGFFVDPKGMKIREHNVEISFSSSSSMAKTTATSDNLKKDYNTAKFEVNGQGANEFGPFFLNGTYYAPNDDDNQTSNNGKTPVYPLELRKWYDDSQASNKPSTNSRKRARQDHDDDDDENDGENVDYELAGLYEEACMSVDELKRRYQISQKNNKHNFDTTTNGSKDNEFHKKNNDDDDSKKRYKRTGLLDDDEDNDDDDDGGCGF